MKTIKLTREMLINGAVDLFGYSASDFEDMDNIDLEIYLSDDLADINAYYN
ncbi:MAG: hypothetical protein KKB37_17070 [Alphaproteobacteria bacterium]|nr:hypothetical protein [Alphaproteobacteria bacterium]